MSMRQGTGMAKGSGSSVHTSSVRVTSVGSGGHYGGGAGGYAGSHRGGSVRFGGGHGFSSGSCVVGSGQGFGGGAGYGAAGFGSGYGVGGGSGFSTGSGFGQGWGSDFEFGGGYGGGYGGGAGFGEGLVGNMNEKFTMQNLNERLAAYLDKVRDLEQANGELERKIHEWYQSQRPEPSKDYSQYFKTIEELQKKIHDANSNNARLILAVDNSRLAADDFRLKYENEHFMRNNVEADINGLKRVLDELHLSRSDLESQINSLKEELADLKKNFEEELKSQKGQKQGDISVDLKTTPGDDLQKVLAEMRQNYEAIMSRNKKEMDEWYRVKHDELKGQMTKDSEEIKTTQTQITELRRTLQNLEIELQAQKSMKASLEATLAETEGRYCMQLSQIQESIHNKEQELANIRCEIENQSDEYKVLLDIKTRLEQEIQTYRNLLEGQGTQHSSSSYGHSSSSGYSASSTSDRSGGSHNVRIRTEDIDGNVTSSRDHQYQPGGYRK